MKCTKTEVKECNVSKCYNAIKENVNKCCKCSQERHQVQFVEEEKKENKTIKAVQRALVPQVQIQEDKDKYKNANREILKSGKYAPIHWMVLPGSQVDLL